jgi:hypothetical protein
MYLYSIPNKERESSLELDQTQATIQMELLYFVCIIVFMRHHSSNSKLYTEHRIAQQIMNENVHNT